MALAPAGWRTCRVATEAANGRRAWEEEGVPQAVTRELLERVDAEFDAARSADEVRAIFKRYYSNLGWKRLCRLFVLQYGVDEMWLGEEERAKKGSGARAGGDA